MRKRVLNRLVMLSVVSAIVLAATPIEQADADCLKPREMREAISSETVLRPAVIHKKARKAAKNTMKIVKTRLCNRGARLVYRLTLLSDNGDVRWMSLDAVTGRVIKNVKKK